MKTDEAKSIDSSKQPVILASNIKDWPGAFGIYQISKAAVMKNFMTFLKLDIIFGIFYLFDFSLTGKAAGNERAHIIGSIVLDLIAVLMYAVIVFAAIKSVNNEEIKVAQAFSAVINKSMNVVTVTIFIAVISLVSIFLLIIPAFFIIPRIYLSVYFVVDQNLNPIDAIKASWKATEGHLGKIYGVIGVNLLILLPIITLIGVLATVYFGFMYYAANAILYVYLTKNQRPKILQS
jgi:hypothetical protein